jgi:hypothetical protein
VERVIRAIAGGGKDVMGGASSRVSSVFAYRPRRRKGRSRNYANDD